MAATATIRDLRNHFPKVRRLVDDEGEVIVTDQGTPKYRLIRYTPGRRTKAPAPKDYLARLRRHQPRPLSAAEAAALDVASRGER
jgi:antitoxin (DNA-binding transcriptional repressor) of toxin-antitoxin stability system